MALRLKRIRESGEWQPGALVGDERLFQDIVVLREGKVDVLFGVLE